MKYAAINAGALLVAFHCNVLQSDIMHDPSYNMRDLYYKCAGRLAINYNLR